MTVLLTRRTFLERAACASALLGIARPAAAADGLGRRSFSDLSAVASAKAEGGWFVSLNGSLTRGVSGADKIRLAAATGYGGVDWDLGPAKTAGLEATRALFAELKIKPAIVGLPMARPLPFGGEQAAFQQALTQLADDAAFTAAVGCQKMMLVLPASTTEPRQEQLKVVRDRLAAVADVLQRSRIRLGLEFLGPLYFRQGRAGGPPATPFIWNMPDALALAKDVGPNAGVVLDAWHWHHSGSTAADILAADKSRIVHLHVSDAKQTPPADVRDNQRLMPGEGIIDLMGFFGALKQIGYADGISPEPLGRVPAEMTPEEAARLALQTTLAVMAKAGLTPGG
jgi:sugar phosphate isomerase/epimerase